MMVKVDGQLTLAAEQVRVYTRLLDCELEINMTYEGVILELTDEGGHNIGTKSLTFAEIAEVVEKE